MGIREDFMIKHVRPRGNAAWALVCEPDGEGSLRHWLLQSGVGELEVEAAFSAWAKTAILSINQANRKAFVKSAELISQARWEEWYQTPKSTILFLDDPLLGALSSASASHKNKDLEFWPGGNGIPLAVTINADHRVEAEVKVNVDGIKVSVDENGNCFHFKSLLNN